MALRTFFTGLIFIFSVIFSVIFSSSAFASQDCVRIFFDAPKNAVHKDGRLYAQSIQNLIGHFPGYRTISSPIETYEKGQIEECRATFYIGSYFDNSIPETFLEDFASTQKSVAWIGYSIWRLRGRAKEALGIEYLRLTELDRKHLDKLGRPTFYRNVEYKGESFEKYGEVAEGSGDFNGAFEISEVRVVSRWTKTLAEAVHNFSGSRLPYAVQNGKKFFIADNPFSYTHEGDRYLVFADLLFDILGEEPLHSKKQAIFRLEDVHAKVPVDGLFKAAAIAKRFGVTMHVATIPVFTDPYGELTGKPQESWTTIRQEPVFNRTLVRLKSMGAKFIWHGVTHQHGKLKNPTGAAGDDWEFWNITDQKPVDEDSVEFVLERLNQGWLSFEEVGIKPIIWEVPHYQASALDYVLFGRVFSWNIGRVGYEVIDTLTGPGETPKALWFEKTGSAGHRARLESLEGVSIQASSSPNGQFFPFEIYNDVYGQKVLPENLGNVQSADGRPVRFLRTVDDILRDARRNLVLRDIWGSFYYHPQLLETARGEKDLERLISGLQAMGYEFVDLEHFTEIRK